MKISVSHGLLVNVTGMVRELFIDTETADLVLPSLELNPINIFKTNLIPLIEAEEPRILETFAGLFSKCIKTNLADFNYLFGDSDTLKLPQNSKKRKSPIKEPAKIPESKLLATGGIQMQAKLNEVTLTGSYKKNAVVSDYHTEELFGSISVNLQQDGLLDMSASQTATLVAYDIYLNAVAQKAVIIGMYADGLIDDKTRKEKLSAIKTKLDYAKSQIEKYNQPNT